MSAASRRMRRHVVTFSSARSEYRTILSDSAGANPPPAIILAIRKRAADLDRVWMRVPSTARPQQICHRTAAATSPLATSCGRFCSRAHHVDVAAFGSARCRARMRASSSWIGHWRILNPDLRPRQVQQNADDFLCLTARRAPYRRRSGRRACRARHSAHDAQPASSSR